MTRFFRVLLVEDTPIAQIIQKNQMINHGCEVETADDGNIALKMANENAYDLIMMDIGLGDGPDGFEVTRLIKEQSAINKETPVVAVTSHDSIEYKQKAIEVGMVEYFNKPFNSADAKKIIDFIKKTKGCRDE